MPGETLTFDIFANDRASETFRRLGLAADSASGDVRQLGDRLDKLGTRVTTARVGLEGNKEANVELDKLDLKLIRLGKKVANPSIDVEGKARALADIAAVDLAMDRLDKKLSGAGGTGFFGHLKNLFTGGGNRSRLGSLGGVAGSAGTGLFGLLSAGGASPYLYGAAGLGAALLAPSLLPLALGGLVGGGAAAGALALGSKANKQLLALEKSLASAKGPQKGAIEAQIRALRQSSAGELGVFGAFQTLGMTAKGVFSSALESTAGGFSGGPGGHPNASFLTGLTGILKQIGAFVKSIGPQLGDLFRASLPYLQAFTGFLEKAAKLLLPAFVQMLNEMAPFLPVIEKGLLNIVKGFVGFLNAIGPSGMRASARIFVVLTEGMAAVLVGLGHTINWLTENIPTWIRKIHNEWDILRHDTAVIFDGIRHDIAAIWDAIFSNSIGRVIRGGHDIEREWNTWTHNTGVIFDAFRHATAVVWDTIWDNTVGRTIQGIGDVVGWFKKLPGRAIGALWGLGHSLYGFAHAALNDFLSGLKAVGGTILSWIGGLWHNIIGAAKKILGVFSPSRVFYDIGKNLMVGLFHGIRDHAGRAVNAAAGAAGAVSGSAGAAQAYARRLAGAYGWASQWADINAVAMRESGWSLTARNPSSGAYGIAQFINGPSEYYQYGGNPNTVAGQVTGFFNYIRQRYGSPGAAWQHELNFGWYDQGGFLPTGLSLAYNATGHPEMVIPGRSSAGQVGGQVVNVYVTVGHGTHPVAAAREIAKILNTGAHSGVRLRTSILGPG